MSVFQEVLLKILTLLGLVANRNTPFPCDFTPL